MSTAEIRRRLEARAAGSDLSGTPRGPLGWKLPIAVATASLALLGLLLYRLRSRRSEPNPDAPAPANAAKDAELDERLARELDAIDTDRDGD